MDVSQRVVSRHCPQCNASAQNAITLPYGNTEWPMVECAQCGFVYLKRAPVYERLSEEFAWEKTSNQERQAREEREPVKQGLSRAFKHFRQKVIKRNKLPELIAKYIPSGHVLDIGCAAGGLLASLPPQYTPHGIEVSKALAEQAHQVVSPRGGSIMHDNALNGIARLPANTYAGVLMSAFLEHEVEPFGLLQGVARVLLPGGVVIIKVPNYGSWNRRVRQEKWCGFRLPDHVNYFTPGNLESMVTRAGLKVIQFGLADRQPTSDNMWIVAAR
ncbi:MAG TPA: methyltransferase domain-containing protein [Limnobacter sp.]|nr:methyltransferase domain-containing protein [Limnobacter sp.]